MLSRKHEFFDGLVPLYRKYRKYWNRYCSEYFRECIKQDDIGTVSTRRCLQLVILAEYVEILKEDLAKLITKVYGDKIKTFDGTNKLSRSNFDNRALEAGAIYIIQVYLNKITNNSAYTSSIPQKFMDTYEAISFLNCLNKKAEHFKIKSLQPDEDLSEAVIRTITLLCDKGNFILEDSLKEVDKKEMMVLEKIASVAAQDNKKLLPYIHSLIKYVNTLTKHISKYKELYLAEVTRSDISDTFDRVHRIDLARLEKEIKVKESEIKDLNMCIHGKERSIKEILEDRRRDTEKHNSLLAEHRAQAALDKGNLQKQIDYLNKQVDFLCEECGLTRHFVKEYLDTLQQLL